MLFGAGWVTQTWVKEVLEIISAWPGGVDFAWITASVSGGRAFLLEESPEEVESEITQLHCGPYLSSQLGSPSTVRRRNEVRRLQPHCLL
jgi:hypothetical protein